jgi:hypothetical protein
MISYLISFLLFLSDEGDEPIGQCASPGEKTMASIEATQLSLVDRIPAREYYR